MSYVERRLLASEIDRTPLIEIVGEDSTERLQRRLQSLLEKNNLQDNALIQDSISLALRLHEDQKRTYEPYVNHVLRVAIRLIEQFEIVEPELIAAAILHDSIEDQASKLIRIQSAELVVPVDPDLKRAMGHEALQYFASRYESNDVADIVLEVSIPTLRPGVSKIRRYLGYTATLMSEGDPRARLIKHADFIDNTDTPLELEDEAKRARLDVKQIGAYDLHIEGLQSDDSLVVDTIRDEIIQIVSQLKADASERINLNDLDEITRLPNSLRSA